MYGIEKKHDFTFLLDRRLLQVCFGLFQIALNFDEDISITVEGSFNLSIEKETSNKEIKKDESNAVLGLIDQTIKKLRVLDRRTLEIVFSNNESLKLYDSNSNSESFQISSPSGTIVV